MFITQLNRNTPTLSNMLTKRNFTFAYPCPRRLREKVKMSAMERETPQTIEQIWTEYHQQRNHTVSKVLKPSLYMQLMQNAQAAPMFVLPVPKEEDNSYFMLVCQNQQKSFILTYLEDFRKNPTAANPYLVLTMFDELVRVKQLALLRGDVISHMTQEEGRVVME